MKKELDYFQVEHLYGGCQDWFTDPMMKRGGCSNRRMRELHLF